LSVALPGVDAGKLLAALADELAASAGAACHAQGVSVSTVLSAMGVETGLASATCRLSIGRFTTEQEIDAGAELILATAHQQ
jgi:cysteine desulfurase